MVGLELDKLITMQITETALIHGFLKPHAWQQAVESDVKEKTEQLAAAEDLFQVGQERVVVFSLFCSLQMALAVSGHWIH